MRMLVTGAAGQVGRALQLNLPDNVRGVFLDKTQLDITDAALVEDALKQYQPDFVINCAAFTNVDGAETSKEQAYLVNERGAINLAKACESQGVVLLQLSTDFVFDGCLGWAYVETDSPNPLNVYGQSKLAGEHGVLKHCRRAIVLRTAWIFSEHGGNFVKAILKGAQELPELWVVADQCGSPTGADDIAGALFTMVARISSDPSFSDWGIYHFAGAPAVSRFEFARHIVIEACRQGIMQKPPTITQIPTDNTGRAIRPENAALNCCKISTVFGIASSDWRPALKSMLARHNG